MVKRRSVVLALVLVVLGLSGAACSSSSDSDPTATGTALDAARTVRLPPANGRFDIQLGGSYAPAAAVRIVDRDRRSAPAKGKYNLCYVNAFQTQPGEEAFWMNPCAKRGYQAVDPDNLDTWTRFDQLTRKGNLALAKLLADHAHDLGLAIGQKNAAELGSLGRKQVGFDFAVVEGCQVYDECDAYTDVYGARVLEIEYTDAPLSAFTEACRARGKTASVILRDRDILPRGRRGYIYRTCG